MTGYRQFEIHQRLDMGAVEMEDALAEIEEAESGNDADNSEDRGFPIAAPYALQRFNNFAYVPPDLTSSIVIGRIFCAGSLATIISCCNSFSNFAPSLSLRTRRVLAI